MGIVGEADGIYAHGFQNLHLTLNGPAIHRRPQGPQVVVLVDALKLHVLSVQIQVCGKG
jgi:hypothetical protein